MDQMTLALELLLLLLLPTATGCFRIFEAGFSSSGSGFSIFHDFLSYCFGLVWKNKTKSWKAFALTMVIFLRFHLRDFLLR